MNRHSFTPWMMLFWLLLTQLAVAFVGRSVGPLGPFIEDGFHLSKAQVGLLPAALFVGQSLVSIPSGWYADVLGTRKMLLILSLMQAGCFLVISISPFFWLLLLCVVFGGMGYGAMHPTSSRGIIYWFPANMSGTAMGIKQMGVTGGSALSALVLLPLAAAWDWRLATAVAAVALLLAGLASVVFYRDAPGERNKTGEERPTFKETFKRLVRNKPLVGVSIAAMGLTSAQISLTTYLVFYVSEALLYPLVVAGVFLALSEISGSAGRVVWGIVSDRFFSGSRLPVLIVIALMTGLSSIAVSLLPPGVSLWLLVILVILFGFSASGFNGIWLNFASESTARRYAGIASGFSLSIGSLGVVVGPPLFGRIVDVTGSYRFAWWFVSLGMVAVIGLLYWAQRQMKQVKQVEQQNSVRSGAISG
jgi:sugar phosphate permease